MTSIEEKLIGRIGAQLTRAVEEADQAYEADREALKKALRDSLRALGRSRDLLPEVGFV
jgi:hypothetical protein